MLLLLAGKDLVTFEELYDLSNPDEPIKVAEHKDIEDEGQTVTIERTSDYDSYQRCRQSHR